MHSDSSRSPLWARALLLLLLGLALPGVAGQPRRPSFSDWARCENGKLAYKTTPEGDRIMDFSSVGYRGGDAAIPDLREPALLARLSVREVKCTGDADDAPAINAAIAQVASGSVFDRETGLRGVVLLCAAECAVGVNSSITIAASGIVLKGANPGGGHTAITLKGSPRSGAAIVIAPSKSDPRYRAYLDQAKGPWLRLGDVRVPAGSQTLEVESCALVPGDKITVYRFGTKEWASELTWVVGCNGGPCRQGWVDEIKCTAADVNSWDGKHGCGMTGAFTRTVVATTPLPQPWPGGGLCRVELDVPVPDSIGDARLGRGWVRRFTQTGRPLRYIGIEGIDSQIPDDINCATGSFFLAMDSCEDCWVRDMTITGYNFGVGVINSRHVTVAAVTAGRTQRWPTVPVNAGPGSCSWRPADFGITGSSEQVLVTNCTSTSENVYSLWTGSLTPGPNVVSNFRAVSDLEPHMRWATGLLVENAQAPISFRNRRNMGTRHGFAVGYSVVWNPAPPNRARVLLDAPRGRPNWLIGGNYSQAATSSRDDCCLGIVDQPGVMVAPYSLYTAQLQVRQLGRTFLCP